MTQTDPETRSEAVPRAPGIVVGVDGSDQSLAALQWAARRARDDGMRLRVVHVRAEFSTASVMLPIPLGIAGDVLSRPPSPPGGLVAAAVALAAAEAPGVDVDGQVLAGRPAETLAEMGAVAEMIVLGARRAGPLRAPLVTSVGGHVAAHAPCPVTVVRGTRRADGPIVLGVDGSDASWTAADFAVPEARRRGLPVVVVHAWMPPPSPAAVGRLATPEVALGPAREEYADAARALLADVVSDLQERFPDVAVEPSLVAGMPETALLNRSKHAAMVVVGSRGRGRVAGLLLGSTSRALVHQAECPVVVARSVAG